MDREQTRQGMGPDPAVRAGPLARAADPVVVILVLAGVFDGLAGNPIHALVLVGAGLGLVAIPPAAGRAPAVSSDEPVPSARPWWVMALPVAIAFGVVAGTLERYTWPVTFAVLVPGIAGLVIASRTRWHHAPRRPLDRLGTGLWVAVLVALGVFELLNFVLQPDRLTGSPDHPTLSTLFNDLVTTHPRQAVALTMWFFFGWWLVDR